MARKRLNKKVALIGSTVFLLLVMAAVVVILRLNRDPAPFIADGDAAWAAQNYEAARENYARAYSLTDSAAGKIELLFKLADVYTRTSQWDKVRQCWGMIITSDPQNVKARLGQLKYSYVLADSLGNAGRSMSDFWDQVLTQARDAFKVIERVGLLSDDENRWEPSLGAVADRRWGSSRQLGPRLRFIRGRAALELARMGAVTAPGEFLKEAEADLQEARKLDPNNPQVYHYLAEVFSEKGDIAASRGSLDEKDAAEKQADDILAEGVRAAGSAADAHIHLLARRFAVAQRGGVAAAREQIKALESQYEGLTQRFESSPRAFAALAQFYSFYAAYLDSQAAIEKLDRAIEAVERARSLDDANVEYPIFAAGYCYRKFSISGDTSALQAAAELAETALKLPEAQDTPGPTQYARRINRFSLCSLLARCCSERVLALPASDPARAAYLAQARKAVHEIGQIQGSGENPEVLKWQGMLDLAEGQTGKAIKSLYAAYEQIKASNPPDERDPFLSYTLADIFKDTSESGAVIEFLGAALSSGIVQTKPDALLDYGDALQRVGSHDVALSAVNSYDERFGVNDRSRALRIRALIGNGNVSEAEERVARLRPDEPDAIALKLDLVRTKAGQLRAAISREKSPVAETPIMSRPADTGRTEGAGAVAAELRECYRVQADLTRSLLQVNPGAVEERAVVELCDSLVQQGDAGLAKAIVETFVTQAPDNVTILSYRALLSEPDPLNCPESRRKEIREQAIHSIVNPIRRALELGSYYQQNEQWDKALPQWRSVLDATAGQGAAEVPAYLRARQLSPRHVAAGHLFDLACHQEDWRLAQEAVDIAQRDDLDDCGGHLFAARLAYARKDRETALNHLDECLRQRPIFSYGYMLRGNVKAELGKEDESIEDVRRAANLNPVDAVVARAVASALFARNTRLGRKLSSQQEQETRQALERAIRLNPRDANLLTVYADFISASEPLKALALRQSLQVNAPSLNNAVMLGKLAMQVALKETDEARKQALFTMAETAFEQARQMEPTNQFMLESYAEYFRARAQNEKARQLLVDSDDSRLLWRHHFRVGEYDEARKLLETMYGENEDRIDALKGLVLVAEETSDRQGVQKYSGELLQLEDNIVNRVAQLRAYLNVGLLQEAQQRLQSFREKYPDEPGVLLMEALVAKRLGQLQRAFDLTNRHLAKEAESASAWRLRGEISFRMGNHDQAILDLRKSRTLEDDPATTVDLAKVYLWMGRDEEAIDELRHVFDRPEAPAEARTLLETTYVKLGRTEALRQLYTDTLADFPNNVFWLNRAGAFALDRRQYEQAEQLFGKAYQLKQQATAGLPTADATGDVQYAATLDGYLRALVLAAGEPGAAGVTWRPEKLDRALQEGGKYVDTPYAPVALYRMAEAKRKLGDMDAARGYCRQAVDKAWVNEQLAVEVLLRAYLMLGGEEVSKYCQERLETAPDSLAANFTMFNLAKLQERHDKAVTHIDKCIQLAGPDTERGVGYIIKKAQVLTTAHKQTSDKTYLQKAIGVYESLRAKMPKNSSVLNNLAYLLAQNDEKLAEALKYAKTAVEQSPNEANYLDTYAYVLYKNGRNAEAAESLAAAIQQYEVEGAAPAEVYEHLGLVNEALGEKGKARAAYRRALEVGGSTMPALARERLSSALERLAQ